TPPSLGGLVGHPQSSRPTHDDSLRRYRARRDDGRKRLRSPAEHGRAPGRRAFTEHAKRNRTDGARTLANGRRPVGRPPTACPVAGQKPPRPAERKRRATYSDHVGIASTDADDLRVALGEIDDGGRLDA